MNDIIQGLPIIGVLKIIKLFFIASGTYLVSLKIINKHIYSKFNIFCTIVFIIVIIISDICIKEISNIFYSTIYLIVLLAILLSKNTKSNIGYSICMTIISISINYILFSGAIAINFLINKIFKIENNILELFNLIIIYNILIFEFLKMKKFKYGFSFLQKNMKSENLDIIILNISGCVLFTIIILTNYNENSTKTTTIGLIILSIIMFITIQKSLQLYYKQKQLIKTLEETQAELEEIKKDNKQLEQENIEISKRSHSLVHKQKSLEYKLNELIAKTEESKQIKQQENSTKGTSKIKTITEQETEIKSRLENISKEIYTEKATIELDKTEIENIDDMLKYQQAECIKNKIEFELQIKGNIHYMVNNLISKEDLEILIADHIKDAIIAINHSENENRNILLRIGKIDENYGIYIYDSGIEFEKETLENLGKKPSTTHTKDGGTGMGFMNTFDILRKSKASLIIREIGKPRKDNFTKVIMIKFNNKEIYKVTSYRKIEIEKSINIEKENKEEIKI